MLVTLDHTTHTYTDEKGRLYKSVSSFIGEFKHAFEPHAIQGNGKSLVENYVERKTKDHAEPVDFSTPPTVSSTLRDWEKKRDYACEKGHAFHSLKELILSNLPFYRDEDGIELPVRNINLIWQFFGDGRFDKLPPGAYTEVCCWNQQAKLAGTMDLLLVYPGKRFRIKDYKTNKALKEYSFKGMRVPFHHLQDCSLGHYTVQLSCYAWLFIQYGWTLMDLEILHYPMDPIEEAMILELGVMPEIEPVKYKINYEQSAIEQAIQIRRQYLNQYR